VAWATGIAIFVSCLGLFGLAAFSAEQRTKEIGIRKVLGASERSIITLLSRDFLRLVALAVLIGSPIGWYVMQKWLQGFAYRTGIGWTVFALTTGTALLIALITISSQAIRAALANPVKSLRSE
jgi:putative ABC transport system permease protein